jgi:hypothetical protein
VVVKTAAAPIAQPAVLHKRRDVLRAEIAVAAVIGADGRGKLVLRQSRNPEKEDANQPAADK